MRRARRNAVLAAAFVAAVVLVARAARKRHGALERNRIFALRVLSGEDPYATPVHAPYPPSYGLVMGPLCLLPITAARIAWALLQLALLGVLLGLLGRWWAALPRVRGPPPAWIPALALLLVFRYLWRDMAGGGGNLVFGTLVMVACLRPGEAPGEDRRPATGLLLGLVLAAKPTPLLFLPWVWLRGRRRTAALAVATAALLHLAPILTLGFDGWRTAWGTWATGVWHFATRQDVFAAPALDFPQFTWMNQSLRVCLARFLGTVPPGAALDSALFFQGAGLAAATVAWIHRAAALLLVAATFVVAGRRRRDPSAWVELQAASLLVCVTLLLSPIAWKSHHVQLLPVFFLLLARIARSARRETQLGVGLAAYLVLCVLLSEAVLGKLGKNVMQSLYVVTLGAVWLWAVTLHLPRPASAGCAGRVVDRPDADQQPEQDVDQHRSVLQQ